MIGEAQEPRKVSANPDEVLQVIEDTKPQVIHVCPHCKAEIYEKHTYMEGEIERHSECKGAIKWPPTDWSKVAPEWRALLQGKT